MKLWIALTLCAALASLCACASQTTRPEATPSAPDSPDPAGAAAADATLAPDPRDVVWRLLDLRGAAARVGVDGTLPELGLQSVSGRVAGSTGVNRFSGPYKLEDGRLSFGALVTTRRAGPEELMKQESLFLAALADCRSWGVLEGQLELRDGKGVVLARFERAGG